MTLDEYQTVTGATDQSPRSATSKTIPADPPDKSEVIPLIGLVGEVGSLLAEYKKALRDGPAYRRFKDELTEELGDILWYVSNVATKFGLSLDAVAAQNIAKVKDRWLSPEGGASLLDDDQPESAQLPRNFSYRFDHNENGRLVLKDSVTGKQVGDPLSNNAYSEDGYRFHDVMHLTFAAMLGWSPVYRKLLRVAEVVKVKRTPAARDDAEDGGRAQVIDEAIVLAAYAYAANHNMLENVKSVDWALLRHVKMLTSDIEVSRCSAKEWNDALLRGFEMWRLLRQHNGGVVVGDLRARTIDFKAPQQADLGL